MKTSKLTYLICWEMVFDRMVKSEIDHVENSIPTHCSGYSFIQKSAISSFFAEITIFFQNLSGNRVITFILDYRMNLKESPALFFSAT